MKSNQLNFILEKRIWIGRKAFFVFTIFIFLLAIGARNLLTIQKINEDKLEIINIATNKFQPRAEPKVNKDVLKKTESLENVPWNNIFDNLEQNSSKFRYVYLVGTDFNVSKKEILISGRTDKYENLLAYVKEFSTNNLFYEVNLLKQDKTISGDVGYPLSFTLSVKWH